MADSSITISALTATGAAGQIVLDFTVDNPTANGLPYLFLKHVEIWAASSNDRAGATKIGEATGRQFSHTGLSASTTRYYWTRPVDQSGNEGDYFPLSATAGKSGTTVSDALGPGSVGTTELADDAVTADKINVNELSAISADIGNITAGTITGIVFTGGRFRTAVSGDRIDIQASLGGYVGAFNSAGNLIGFFGTGPAIGPVVYADKDQGGGLATAHFRNESSGGYALQVLGRANFVNGIGGAAISAEAGLNAANSTALRGSNTASGGGDGGVGLSGANSGWSFFDHGGGGYGPFTGGHDALIEKGDEASVGDIVIDDRVLFRRGVSDTLTAVKLATRTGQKGAVGILARRSPLDPARRFGGEREGHRGRNGSDEPSFIMKKLAGRYDQAVVNGLGEGQMNVCGRGGDIEAGDLIVCSSLPGKGERQEDDLVRANTVARAREAVRFNDPDQVKRVAVIYLCG